jgi:sarcosine oxidase subunit beta
MEFDVIIIGGGLSGCATGYFLAKGGLRVLIIEQRNIASGASGRNGSCITKMDSRTLTPERVKKRIPFVLADLELLKHLEKELDEDIGLQQFGAIDIASSDYEIEEIKKMIDSQKAGGDNVVEFLDRDGIYEVCPIIGKSALAAKYTRTDGSLNPIKLTVSLAQKAMNLYNLEILQWTRVEKIVFRGSKAIGVKNGQRFYRDWTMDSKLYQFLAKFSSAPNPFFPCAEYCFCY